MAANKHPLQLATDTGQQDVPVHCKGVGADDL